MSFRYIAILDTDELIIPKIDYSWPDVLKKLERSNQIDETTVGIMFKHAFHFHQKRFEANEPECEILFDKVVKVNLIIACSFAFPFKYLLRSQNFILKQQKSFHRTDLPVTECTHRPLHCLNLSSDNDTLTECNNIYISKAVGHLAHYSPAAQTGSLLMPRVMKHAWLFLFITIYFVPLNCLLQ